jgi:mono/diheme cytochrome c family protein
MKFLKFGGMGLLVLLLLIQLYPYGRDHSNPPVQASVAWDSPQTAELFKSACADCHSHETVWPWYSHVAPVSWLVQHDVEEGREHFNISLPAGQQGDADEAAEEVKEGEMPPKVYLPTHPEARLSPEDQARLVAGLEATFRGSEH